MRFPISFSYGIKKNGEPEEAKDECSALFRKAKKSIKIIAGDLNNAFYEDSRIIAALKDATKKKKILVEIAYYPGAQTAEKPVILTSVPQIKFYRLSKPTSRHMMSIDGKHGRIEEGHIAGVKRTPAIICLNAPTLAADIDSKFAELTTA